MNVVKQPEDSAMCMLACLAMVTGRVFEDAYQLLYDDGPRDSNGTNKCLELVSKFHPEHKLRDQLSVSAYGVVWYLLQHDKHLMGPFRLADLDLVQAVERSRKDDMNLKEFLSVPAIVTVKSLKYPDTLHCVVFNPNDPLLFLDPNEGYADVGRYTIVSWEPIQDLV